MQRKTKVENAILVLLLTATCKKRGVIEIQNYQNMKELNKSTDLENTTKQPYFLHDVMGSVYHCMTACYGFVLYLYNY